MNDYANLILPLCLYFLPAIVVLLNARASWKDRRYVTVLNLLLGWTIIGYFVIMMLALLNFRQIRKNNHEKARVRRAKANFYLREEAKNTAS